MIYYSIIPESLTTADFEKIYSDISPLLPDFRRKKAEGIIPARERAVSALSFVLLCRALSREYSWCFTSSDTYEIGHRISFRYGRNGKPYLEAPFEHIFFNISHCKTAIACAVAPFELGLDIQDIRKPSPALLKRMPYAMDEYDFSSFWSRYEAYTKLTSDGIVKSLWDCEYMSDSFLERNDIRMTIFDILADKKTAAYLSAAFCNKSCVKDSILSPCKEKSFDLHSIHEIDFLSLCQC